MRSLIAILLLVPLVASAEIYRYVDDEGNVVFTDEPPADDAEPLELEPLPTTRFETGTPPPATDTADQPATGPAYARVAIAAPAPEATVRNATQTVPVSVELEPALQPDHTLTVFLDGQPRITGATGTSHTLENVYRGRHTVAAAVLDAAGNEIARSETVTFFKHQPSALN